MNYKKVEYYSASWCGPCRMMKPVIKALIDEGYDVDTIDIDKEALRPTLKGIRGVPTFIFYEDGEEKNRLVGAVSKKQITDLLD